MSELVKLIIVSSYFILSAGVILYVFFMIIRDFERQAKDREERRKRLEQRK